MSIRTFDRYELGRKTSTDILNNEKTEIDDVETNTLKKENVEAYKNRHAIFLQGLQDKGNAGNVSKIDDIKKVQMRVYASNSSELYLSSSPLSTTLSILAIICMTFLFAVVLEVLLLNSIGCTPRIYNSADMSPLIENGDTIFEISAENTELSVETIITYQKSGVTYTRVITEMNGTTITVNTPDGNNPDIIPVSTAGDVVESIVITRISAVGAIVTFTYQSWYYICGFLLIATILLFAFKLLVDRKFNERLLEMLEYEKIERDKRRKYLSEDIIKMQKNKNMNFSNVNILSGLLNVNKEPDNKRARKMQKLQNQLQQRKMKQIEAIRESAIEDKKQLASEEKKVEEAVKEQEAILAGKPQDETTSTAQTQTEQKNEPEVKVSEEEKFISDIRKEVQESVAGNKSLNNEEVNEKIKMAEKANKTIEDN